MKIEDNVDTGITLLLLILSGTGVAMVAVLQGAAGLPGIVFISVCTVIILVARAFALKQIDKEIDSDRGPLPGA